MTRAVILVFRGLTGKYVEMLRYPVAEMLSEDPGSIASQLITKAKGADWYEAGRRQVRLGDRMGIEGTWYEFSLEGLPVPGWKHLTIEEKDEFSQLEIASGTA